MVKRCMTTRDPRKSLTHLSDTDLLAETKRLASQEREATAAVVVALMELDARKLYRGEGCPSLFAYCTEVLHFSEQAAYSRIEAARVARRVPQVLDLLTNGGLTLTTVGLLAPHLTPENQAELIASTRSRSKRDVERVIAAFRPRPDLPSTVRKLATSIRLPVNERSLALPISVTRPGMPAAADDVPPAAVERPAHRPVVVPLSPERYKIQVTISQAAYDHLRQAQNLLRHVIPTGNPAAVIERALALLVEDLERRKLAATKAPRSARAPKRGSRHVPSAVKREVWARDGGRCAFVGAEGRCTERGFLELHHLIPFADGGPSSAGNLQLRCRAHNDFEAERWFGALDVAEGVSSVP
jgi:hypothetical protein